MSPRNKIYKIRNIGCILIVVSWCQGSVQSVSQTIKYKRINLCIATFLAQTRVDCLVCDCITICNVVCTSVNVNLYDCSEV